jgi:histidine phosphotransferase ChpT
MDRGIDHRIVELLASHLCHEIISPVTAVNNGLELIAGGDSDLVAEAMGLMRQSAAEASRKLQFYRLAYGQAAGFEGGRGLAQARELCEGLLKGGKISLSWAEKDVGPVAVDKLAVKLLVNVIALAREALPRGGTINVALVGPSPVRAEVSATGTGARLSPEAAAAMAKGADVASLTPRTVQAFLVAWLAQRIGAGLAVETGADRVTLTASLESGI